MRRRLQRGDKVRPKQRGIAVALVEREPRRGPSVGGSGCQPLRQQRRLTEPGWSADSAPRLRRSLSLGRATRPPRRLGTWSLVSSSGPAMTTSPQEPVFTFRRQALVASYTTVGSRNSSCQHVARDAMRKCGAVGRLPGPPLDCLAGVIAPSALPARWNLGFAGCCHHVWCVRGGDRRYSPGGWD